MLKEKQYSKQKEKKNRMWYLNLENGLMSLKLTSGEDKSGKS